MSVYSVYSTYLHAVLVHPGRHVDALEQVVGAEAPEDDAALRL